MKKLKNNFTVKVVVSLLIISIIIGLLTFLFYKPDLSLYLDDFINKVSNTKQNVFLLNLSVLALIFIASIIIVGVPLMYMYLFYEGFSIGFTIGVFIYLKGIKGIMFYLLFLFVSKLIYIVLILYFIVVSTRFSKSLIYYLVKRRKDELYNSIILHFYRFLIVIIISLINSTLIYFFANKVLVLSLSLIK